MEIALYGIYALVVFVSEILLVRCAHSFDFWYVNNSCVNTVRQHFPWSILYIWGGGILKVFNGTTVRLITTHVSINERILILTLHFYLRFSQNKVTLRWKENLISAALD